MLALYIPRPHLVDAGHAVVEAAGVLRDHHDAASVAEGALAVGVLAPLVSLLSIPDLRERVDVAALLVLGLGRAVRGALVAKVAVAVHAHVPQLALELVQLGLHLEELALLLLLLAEEVDASLSCGTNDDGNAAEELVLIVNRHQRVLLVVAVEPLVDVVLGEDAIVAVNRG